ncbi:lipopolysaccharide assembly protein LapB [Brachyspira sp.]|uniref:tetratricopeptide repeat protein n=1 Tax=Brachyspira sp. TaxID=1977261 RepID=UPI002611F24F|nr:tetratricopeptide repeat protein [Brachyspira sp.]
MPYLYNVEKKISIHIIAITLIVSVTVITIIYLFTSNYIEKKRLKSIYDYIAIEDYDNASFLFNDIYTKKPLNKNILKTGIDLYYDILIRSDKKEVIVSASESIIRYAKQLLLTSKFINNENIIYQRLGYSYQRLGKSYYIDSYNSYINAINNGDNRVSTTIELSKVCYEIRLYKDAIKYLEDAIDRELKESSEKFINMELYYELANAYEGNKDYTKAIQILSSMDGKFNNNTMLESRTYFKLGNLYSRQGLYKESEFFYKKALDIDDKNPDLYYSIGTLYLETKRRNEAIKMFREAIKIDNSYKPARDTLRRL